MTARWPRTPTAAIPGRPLLTPPASLGAQSGPATTTRFPSFTTARWPPRTGSCFNPATALSGVRAGGTIQQDMLFEPRPAGMCLLPRRAQQLRPGQAAGEEQRGQRALPDLPQQVAGSPQEPAGMGILRSAARQDRGHLPDRGWVSLLLLLASAGRLRHGAGAGGRALRRSSIPRRPRRPGCSCSPPSPPPRTFPGASGWFRTFILGPEQSLPIVKPYGIAFWQDRIYLCDSMLAALVVIDLSKTALRLPPAGRRRAGWSSRSTSASTGTARSTSRTRRAEAVVVLDSQDRYAGEMREGPEARGRGPG